MNLTKMQQNLLAAALLVGGLLYGYYQFLWKPAMVEIRRLQETLSTKQKELEAAQRASQQYAEFKKEVAKLKRWLDALTLKVPKDLSEVEVSAALSRALLFSGMRLTGFSRLDPGKGVKNPAALLKDQPIQVNLSGGYRAFLKLLYGLTRGDLLVDYGKIQLSPLSGAEETLTATLIVQGYGLK